MWRKVEEDKIRFPLTLFLLGELIVWSVFGILDRILKTTPSAQFLNIRMDGISFRGGFLASRSAAVKQYAKMFGSSHMFSNALSPVQSAVALASTQIIRSSEGDERRAKLLEVVRVLRHELSVRGLTCLGQPGAIVPVIIGNERMST